MRTRIAPTPSGYLHLGNCVNARLIADVAAESGGTIALRIDDMDSLRVRPEYVDDIFRVLESMGIVPDEGPHDRADFEANFAMALRTDDYRAHLEALRDGGAQLFVCTCSRATLSGGMCVRGCADADLVWEADVSAVRMRLPDGLRVEVSGESIDLRAAHGDVVMWRREDLPAYHLVTVIEDHRTSMTHVIRGSDLLASSALHIYLASLLQVQPPAYLHHPLIVDAQGAKLSKSVLAANGGSPLAMRPENLEFIGEQAKGLRVTLR